jgi:SET domain-containing protein
MLEIKKSQIPKSGQGLWTKNDIRKGDIVCEYIGDKITWKECERRNAAQVDHGGYYFFINARNCVDAQYVMDSFGRYANDATGFTRVAGLRNNSKYEVRKGKPYIIATRNISAGSEILVNYGRGYWKTMEANYKKIVAV